VLEAILQGGAGAVLAIASLVVLLGAARVRFGSGLGDALGLGSITFLPPELSIVLLLGGMLLGGIGGLIVARGVR
jgi:hypothetical protein